MLRLYNTCLSVCWWKETSLTSHWKMFQLHLRRCKVLAVLKARGCFVNCTLWTTQPSCWIWTRCKRLMGGVRHLVVGFDVAVQPGNFLSNQFGDVLLDWQSGEKRLGAGGPWRQILKGLFVCPTSQHPPNLSLMCTGTPLRTLCPPTCTRCQ